MVTVFLLLRNFISPIPLVEILRKRVAARPVLLEPPLRARGPHCAIILSFPIPMPLTAKTKWGDPTCTPNLFPTCHKMVCLDTMSPWNTEVPVIQGQGRESGLRIQMEMFLCTCLRLKAWIQYPRNVHMLPVFKPRYSRPEPWVMPVLASWPMEWTMWVWPGQTVSGRPSQNATMVPLHTVNIWLAPTPSLSFPALLPLRPPPPAIVRIPLALHILWPLSVVMVVVGPWTTVVPVAVVVTPTQPLWARTWCTPTLSLACHPTVAWLSPRSTRMKMEAVSQSKFSLSWEWDR